MQIAHTITLDLARWQVPPRIFAKQYDNGARYIVARIRKNGLDWTPPENTTGLVRFCKADGNKGLYDKLQDGHTAAVEIADGSSDIIINLDAEVLTCAGPVEVDVVLINGPTAVGTTSFAIDVERSPAAGTTPSGSYYRYQSIGEINDAIKQLEAKSVRSVNGVKPDASGNVTVQIPSSGVTAVNGRQGSVRLAVNALVECQTPPTTAIKQIKAFDGFTLISGATLGVKFLYSNTAENPRLSYAGQEMSILDRLTGKPIDPGDITAGVYHFQVSPTGWLLLDKQQSSGTATPVPGDKGEDGGYWAPSVADDGTLTWTPSKEGMGEAPAAANIKGPTGDQGPAGPKGDPGEIGPQGNPGKDGVTPNLQIGTVTTLPAGSSATAEITGTTANPMLNLGIPKGADATGGSAGVSSINDLTGAVSLPISGSCVCNSDASDRLKVLTSVSAGFDPSADGAILAVQFKNPGNTATNPELQIGQTVYAILHPNNLTPPAASALKKSVHHFSMRGSTRAAILLDPYVAPSTVNVDATLTQSGQAADAKIVGSALATRVPAAPLDSDAGKVATVGSDGIPRWETLPAVGSLFGRCSTAACDAAKKATYIDGSVAGGTIITVEFVNANEAENPTLTANGVTGAIVGRTLAPISATSLTAGVHRFVCLSNYNKWMMLDAPDELEYIGEYTLAEDVGVWEIASDLSGAPLQLKKMYFELHIQPAQVNIDNNISNTHARMTVPTWANAYGVNTCVSGYPMLRKTAYKENPGWGQLWEIRTLNGRNVVFRRSKGASCAATVSAGEAAGPGHITGLGLSSLDPTKAQFGAGSTVKIWGAKI